LVFFLFDLLHLVGEDLTARALTERKTRLAELLARANSSMHYSDHQIGLGPAFYEKACALSVEGIVSKRADAPYAPGNRGLWLKVKCLNREEFVVIGWTDPEGSRPFLGACCSGITIPTESSPMLAGSARGSIPPDFNSYLIAFNHWPSTRCRLTWHRRARRASARRWCCRVCIGSGPSRSSRSSF